MRPKEGQLECVTGDLGGGKSAYAVELIYEHVARGGWAFTNIEVFPDENHPHPAAKDDNFRKRLASEGLEFDPQRLVRLQGDSMAGFHKQLKRGSEGELVMAVIDESQLDIHTKDRGAGNKDELYNFIAMCRKLDIWCIFIAHDANEIDVNVRRKITIETTCRNLKNETILGMPFPIQVYFRVQFKLFQGRSHHKIGAEYFRKSPAWGLYNSKALLGAKAQQFETLEVARAGRLKRIKREDPSLVWNAAAIVGAVTAGIILCV